jgi:hypothetical protein
VLAAYHSFIYDPSYGTIRASIEVLLRNSEVRPNYQLKKDLHLSQFQYIPTFHSDETAYLYMWASIFSMMGVTRRPLITTIGSGQGTPLIPPCRLDGGIPAAEPLTGTAQNRITRSTGCTRYLL